MFIYTLPSYMSHTILSHVTTTLLLMVSLQCQWFGCECPERPEWELYIFELCGGGGVYKSGSLRLRVDFTKQQCRMSWLVINPYVTCKI